MNDERTTLPPEADEIVPGDADDYTIDFSKEEGRFIAQCLEQWSYKTAGNQDDAARAREIASQIRSAVGQ